jgi:signal transducing adaptor molecule
MSSRTFVDALMKQLANKSVHGTAKFRMLDLIQQWAEQFKNDSDLAFLVTCYENLKSQSKFLGFCLMI